MAKKAKRVFGYSRVSHDEQKKFGASVEAQQDKIRVWCEEEGHQLVEIYTDEGFTAANMKRPALKEMLANLKNADIVVFTRLDRFSRNVLEANEMLGILQAFDVALVSIEEDDIDTSTADGLFMFQLKVSLAEREVKKGSERILSVFEYKIKEGQAITGCQPYGYRCDYRPEGIYVAKDEEVAGIIDEAFAYFRKYHSIRGTMSYINEKFGISRGYGTYHKLFTDSYYTGAYRGNPTYCEPYITQEEYDRNQVILKSNVRERKTRHVHIFSGLVRCPHCGGAMSGQSTTKKGKIYYSYRCNRTYQNGTCDFRKSFTELNIEDFLLKNVRRLAEEYAIKVQDVKPVERDKSLDRLEEVKAEMEALTYAFRKRRITIEEYDKDFEELEAELAKLEAITPEEVDLSVVKGFLTSGWENIYHGLERKNKLALWRNTLAEISADEELNFTLRFL